LKPKIAGFYEQIFQISSLESLDVTTVMLAFSDLTFENFASI